jgi:hypothetical protein
MRFSRIIFVGPGLCILIFIVALGIGGCPNDHKTAKVNCAREINVSSSSGVSAEHSAVYVCTGDKVTWNVGQNKDLHFTVKFDEACPFESCSQIDEAHPTVTVQNEKSYPKYLTVYKYTIRVGDKVFDPHVIGGGGHGAK